MQITGKLRGPESMPPESAGLDLVFRVHTGSYIKEPPTTVLLMRENTPGMVLQGLHKPDIKIWKI
jgi:hypothetical protein